MPIIRTAAVSSANTTSKATFAPPSARRTIVKSNFLRAHRVYTNMNTQLATCAKIMNAPLKSPFFVMFTSGKTSCKPAPMPAPSA